MIDLEAIKARADAAERARSNVSMKLAQPTLVASAMDVPALIAEVERLAGLVASTGDPKP